MSRSPSTIAGTGCVAALGQQTLVPRLETVAQSLRDAAELAEGDAELVHRLRVATRRAAVAVRMFEELLPEDDGDWWAERLRSIRRSADAARDDDVLTERLRNEPSGRDVARLLERGLAHRRAAQQPLRDAASRLIATHTLDEAIAAVSRTLESAVEEEACDAPDSRRWSAQRLKWFRSRFLKASKKDLRDGSRLHRFRIRTKQLRYALELVADLFPPDAMKRVLKTVESLQERLGRINDHRAAADRFRRWEADADDAEEVEYLQANRLAELAAFRTARDETLEWWGRRRRKRLKRRLKRLLKGAERSRGEC